MKLWIDDCRPQVDLNIYHFAEKYIEQFDSTAFLNHHSRECIHVTGDCYRKKFLFWLTKHIRNLNIKAFSISGK